MRIFDTKLKKWRIVWVLPEANIVHTLVGGAVDDRIVLAGVADDGALLQWSFNDMRDDSFVWLGEKSRDGAKLGELPASIKCAAAHRSDVQRRWPAIKMMRLRVVNRTRYALY